MGVPRLPEEDDAGDLPEGLFALLVLLLFVNDTFESPTAVAAAAAAALAADDDVVLLLETDGVIVICWTTLCFSCCCCCCWFTVASPVPAWKLRTWQSSNEGAKGSAGLFGLSGLGLR